jgi:hypothetical protein
VPVTCLWSQVESQVTASGQVIFNQERNLIGQAKLDSLGKSRSLAEVDEVFKGESQRDRFGELNFDVQFWLLDVVVASKSDSTIANITRAGELDTILGCLDRDYRVTALAGAMVKVSANVPDSERAIKSMQILLNSEEGMEIVAAYSVSGIPKCSWSISISFKSYSLNRSLSLLSKTKFKTSGASSALIVRISSPCAARRTLVRDVRLTPRATLRSHRYGENVSALSIMETSATCELSMA